MGKYDRFLVGLSSASTTDSAAPASGRKYAKFTDGLSASDQSNPGQKPAENKWLRRASNYAVHPLIEGGGMAAGGAAAGIAALPASPLASAVAAPVGAVAMYPPSHAAANAVDRMMGLEAKDIPVGEALKDGAMIEAGGRLIGPALNAAGKLLPGAAAGEALSGTPKSNLSRAFNGGFVDTYLKPKSLAEATDHLATAKNNLMLQHLTPEEQVAMTVNPRGEAQQKISDTMLKWLRGEPISTQDAVAAKQAITTVFPPDTAKAAMQRGKLGQFRSELNNIIGTQNPEYKVANDEYAASRLRSQLSKPARVNKTNPDQYSKLGLMITNSLGALGGMAHGGVSPEMVTAALVTTLASSPLTMGLASSIVGSLARAGGKTVGPAVRSAVGSRAVSTGLSRLLGNDGSQ